MGIYEEFLELTERLETETDLIESPPLWTLSENSLNAAMLNDLAQPLPDGTPSPFSSPNPASGHAILVSILTRYISYLGFELNLKADWEWVQLLRMQGVERRMAEYPIINIVFRRSPEARQAGLICEIPYNTEIRSIRDSNLSVYTLKEARIIGSEEFATVPARLSQVGSIRDFGIRIGEFSDVPRLFPNLAGAANDGTFVSEGQRRESLSDLVKRAREDNQRPKTLSTFRDYHNAGKAIGAGKTLVLSSQYGVIGHVTDLITVALYPAAAVPRFDATYRSGISDERITPGDQLPPAIPVSQPVRVIPANIIPIDGTIQVSFIQGLNPSEQFNLVARTIGESVNPPAGSWGDRDFARTLATALELAEGIYAVPKMNLKHSVTGQPLSEIEVLPWSLLEIQNTLRVEAA